MNNEIKEILQMLESIASNDDISFLPKQATLLLYYITNLQQEIDKLTAESTEWESKCYDLQQETERQSKAQVILDNMLVDYKQENEELLKKSYSDDVKITKAIELIKEAGCYNESTKSFNDDIWYDELPDLLNILQNGDNNETNNMQ